MKVYVEITSELEAGVLLAHNAQGRKKISQKMQSLSGARQNLSPLIRATDVSYKPLAFSVVGTGHIGTSAIGKGQCKFIVIAMDYFTKWAEVEPLATIIEQKVRNFV